MLDRERGGRFCCCCCCCRCCRCDRPSHRSEQQAAPGLWTADGQTDTAKGLSLSSLRVHKPEASPGGLRPAGGGGGEDRDEGLRLIERAFVRYYVPFVRSRCRLPFLAAFAVFFGISAYFALQLTPPTSQERWFPDDHMVQRLADAELEFFGGDVVNYIKVDLSWGIAGVDRSKLNRWVPVERGEAIFAKGFNPRTKQAHIFVDETCRLLASRQCNVMGCMDGSQLLTRRLSSVPLVDCFMDDWRRWLCSDLAATARMLPSCASQTVSCSHHNSSAVCAASTDCQWHGGSCKPLASFDELPIGAAYSASLSSFRDANTKWRRHVGTIDGELKYLSVRFTTTLEDEQSQDRVSSVVSELEKFVAERNLAAPQGMKGAFFSQSGGDFAWASTQQGLVDNVFFGFMIVFPAAFCTLFIATRNVQISFMAILTIVGVVSAVLGMCKWGFKWDLGISESIAAVIVIGFAVDFTVHLAHMYIASPRHSRADKMAESARTMGVTIFMGAVTTLGAGVFMSFCTVTFFTKFCILICSTIGFSLLAALLFFMPLVATLGPEGNCDNIAWLRQKCTRMESQDRGP